MDIRVGIGFDSHVFERGKRLKLGGVHIDFPYGLRGHSDGDVLLHAITDALLGACGEGDIGTFFPDRDPRWKDADSRIFLETALTKVKRKGFELANLDCVIVADRPKIAPYRRRIVKNLSRLLRVAESKISVKGKRREGFIQMEDGMACLCVVLLIRRCL